MNFGLVYLIVILVCIFKGLIMTIDLIIVHILFISACVYFSYQNGAKAGRSEMVEDLLDRKLITETQLRKEYFLE